MLENPVPHHHTKTTIIDEQKKYFFKYKYLISNLYNVIRKVIKVYNLPREQMSWFYLETVSVIPTLYIS